MRRVCTVSLLTIGAFLTPAAETPDPLLILKRSQDAYSSLKSYQMQGFMVIETSNADFEQILKSRVLLASELPGKFHVDVKTPGGLTMVANGKQTWTFNPMLKQYTSSESKPDVANALKTGPASVFLPEQPGQTVKSAKLIEEANLNIGGVPHLCYVMGVEYTGRSPSPAGGPPKLSKLWIDKSTYLVLKRTSEEHLNSFPPFGIPADMKMTLEVEALTGQPLSPELFTFTPPTGSKLVEKFQFAGMMQGNDLTGKHSVDFRLKDLSDNEVHLADYKGKTVVLDFWATWCAPCRAEIPVLNKLHRDNPGLIVLGIDVSEDADVVQKFVKENKIEYPILLAGQGGVVNDYSAHSLPTVVVIDKQGDIRSYKVGYDPGGDEQLRASVAEAGNHKPLAGAYKFSGAEPAPTVLYRKEPSYTEEARKAKISGTVLVTLVVGADGIPSDIKVVRGLGYGLNESAVAAVKDWRFKPDIKDGKPVAAYANIEVNFRLLDGPPAEAEARTADPKTAEEAYRRGMLAFRTRHPDEALALLGKAIAMKPDWALPYIGRARAEYQERRYTEAIHDFDEAIRLDPKCAQCFDTRGLAYSYSGQHARAIEDYTRAIALNPQSAAPYNNRGWAYTALGKPEKALEDLNAATRIAPDYAKAQENRALAYTKLQDWPQAIAGYTAAIEANPSRWQYERRAEAKRAAGDVQGAEEDLQKAAQLPVNSGEPPSQ